MTLLVFLRHAEAVTDDPGGDHARVLSERGRAQATSIGARLRASLVAPVLVLASDARRTMQTAERAFPHLKPRPEPGLYAATPADILQCLRALDGLAGTVVVVGHNPGLSDIARQMSDGREDAEARRRLDDGFPPAAAAIFAVEAPWAALGTGTGWLVGTAVPDGTAWPA